MATHAERQKTGIIRTRATAEPSNWRSRLARWPLLFRLACAAGLAAVALWLARPATWYHLVASPTTMSDDYVQAALRAEDVPAGQNSPPAPADKQRGVVTPELRGYPSPASEKEARPPR